MKYIMTQEIRIGQYPVVSLLGLSLIHFHFDCSNVELTLVFSNGAFRVLDSYSGYATLAEMFKAARELGVVA